MRTTAPATIEEAAMPPESRVGRVAEAAALLRSLGWTVVPPVDPEAAIPEPEVGQVWLSPKPRIDARTVVGLEGSAVPVVRYSTRRYARLWTSAESWRAWARKSGARP